MDRKQLRQQIRVRRRALTTMQRRHYAHRLARTLSSQALFWRAKRIAVYLPNDGEMDLTPLIQRCIKLGKRCYLPVISRIGHNRLWFADYRPGQKLRANLYGIPEPANGKWRGRSAIGLDLILMPLVGFDEQGNRLGMGGGYYDRTLAFLRHRQYWRRPMLLGVAYEFQSLEKLDSEVWDVPMHGVITETKLRLWR